MKVKFQGMDWEYYQEIRKWKHYRNGLISAERA